MGDGDIAPAGATNVAFTISYDENNVGAGDLLEDIPVAINRFDLFNKSALKNVSFVRMLLRVKDMIVKSCMPFIKMMEYGLDDETMRNC